MSTGHAKSLHLPGQRAEYLCALLYLEAVLLEISQFLVGGRNGRGVHNQARLAPLAGMRYLIDIFFVVKQHAFFLQPASQLGGGLVVAGHDEAATDKVTCDGTHANAAGTYEINCSYLIWSHGENV